MTTTPAQPEPIGPFIDESRLPEGVSATFTFPCRDCGETVRVVAGSVQPHEHTRPTITLADQPEPIEREVLDLARAITASIGGRTWASLSPLDHARTALAWFAARPAPVVSAAAVESATTRLVESGEVPIPWDANPWDYVRDAVVGVLAALGITVADTPAAPVVSAPLKVEWGVVTDSAGSTDVFDALDQAEAHAVYADGTCPIVRIETWPHTPGTDVTDTPAADDEPEPEQCGYTFPLPWWAGEDQMDPCRCDLPKGHPPTGHKTGHECEHIREDTPAAEPVYEVSPGAFMTVEDCTPTAPERCRYPGALVIPPTADDEGRQGR